MSRSIGPFCLCTCRQLVQYHPVYVHTHQVTQAKPRFALRSTCSPTHPPIATATTLVGTRWPYCPVARDVDGRPTRAGTSEAHPPHDPQPHSRKDPGIRHETHALVPARNATQGRNGGAVTCERPTYSHS